MSTRIMVLGLGNALNGDDGLGFYAIRDLNREDWPADVRFVHRTEFEWNPLFFEGCQELLLLDTVCCGNEPGTVYVYDHEELQQYRASLRSPWILNAVAFSSVFSDELQMQLMGIEPEFRECRVCLTPTVSSVYSEFLQAARSGIHTMLDRVRESGIDGAGASRKAASAR
ncbi:MAG: hydrogenase maturation protease [Desulfohalobiaceae bacterium]